MTALAQTPRRLVDSYLDTDDWRMARAGFVVRTRRRGRHDEVTMKDTAPGRGQRAAPAPRGDRDPAAGRSRARSAPPVRSVAACAPSSARARCARSSRCAPAGARSRCASAASTWPRWRSTKPSSSSAAVSAPCSCAASRSRCRPNGWRRSSRSCSNCASRAGCSRRGCRSSRPVCSPSASRSPGRPTLAPPPSPPHRPWASSPSPSCGASSPRCAPRSPGPGWVRTPRSCTT